MLNISNKFENYQCGEEAMGSVAGGTDVTHSIDATLSTECSVNFTNMSPIATSSKSERQYERESIHSGQFMVSHFEAEEAQDDLDDGEVKMLDPEDPTLSKPYESNRCMEIQLYVPRKATYFQERGDFTSTSSHIEIETSLTKLFKCMTLAYSQKLTSPKWNHFKGVRLRWKDKIRLNNVIWRCWHMQFILKRRTPVCQFASPLDVDIHSNPQSVVLEGKYWKRQLAVIKAEYRKWRRNYKSKATGSLTYDTKSEFDFLEWSPLNDRNLMISEDWTSDTLFSAINVPFPFPDPREIARGAGIADFIQPSLGPLQPNLEDIDLTFEELLQNSRLPPVPEEGTDEMLKNVDYGFSSMLGAEQMDASHIINVTGSNVIQIENNDDTNMVELNTPLSSMQFSEIEQQFAANSITSVGLPSGQTANNTLNSDGTLMMPEVTTPNRTQTKHYNNAIDSSLGKQNNEFPGKSVIKGRISKSQRPFRREPHNYDKAQPTLHQTSMYQQMLAEQQKTQLTHHQQLSTNINAGVLQHQTSSFPQEQQQPSHQYSTHQFSKSSPTSVLRLNSNVYVLNSDSTLASNTADTNLKNFNLIPATSNVSAISNNPAGAISSSKPQMVLDVKTEPPSSDILSMFNLTSNNGYTSNTSYKPYPSVMNFKKSASTGTYINMHGLGINQNYAQDQTESQTSTHVPLNTLSGQLSSLTNAMQIQQQQQQQHQQQHQQQMQSQAQIQQLMHSQQVMPKEMFRSNSLPLNVSLQKLDAHLGHDNNFAVPKYQAKSTKPRSRSNSINQHTAVATTSSSYSTNNLRVSQQLQAATSDPMLNSTLAQLLTASTRMTSLVKQQSSSTSAISSINNPMTTDPITIHTSPNKPQMVHGPTSNIFIQKANSPRSSTLPLSSSAFMGPIVLASPTKSQEIVQQQAHLRQQPKSPKKSSSLPTQTTSLALHSPPASKMLSYPPMTGTQNTSASYISHSPESFHDQDSPLSPTHSSKYPRDSQRRAGHIHAEQKRRYNIKNGFDMLHSLIPQLQQNPNAKLSKAAMLQKAADHIKHLRSERNVLKNKMDALRKERDALNNSLSHLHSILPANGAPVTRQGTENVRQLYEQYVRYHTVNNNWKFWILGLILEPLLSSYTSSVSSASMDELRRTAFLWVDQHCSLIDLRPAVSNKLKYLSMKTDILSDPPSTLQEEIEKAINHTTSQHPNLHGT